MNQYIMPQFIIVHCKHEGCYNPLFFKDENPKIRVASVQINPPKVFLFDNKPEAKEFFRDYINDVDVLDERCKIDEDINNTVKQGEKTMNTSPTSNAKMTLENLQSLAE